MCLSGLRLLMLYVLQVLMLSSDLLSGEWPTNTFGTGVDGVSTLGMRCEIDWLDWLVKLRQQVGRWVCVSAGTTV